MEIDIFHRYDLGIPSAGRTAFDAEARSKAWLAQTDDGLLTDMIERIAQTDGGRGFAFSGSCGSDCRNQDQLCIRAPFERPQIVQRNLGLIVAIEQKVTQIDA